MALKPSNQPKQESKFAPQPDLEAGTYPARLVQILELGLQPQRPYKGEAKKPANEIMFTYELVDAFMQDEEGNDIEDKPRWVSETLPFYGLFADKAVSTKRYLALDPEQTYEGDFAALIDTPCNVTLAINKSGDKTYTNVTNVTAMRPRDAAKTAALVNPSKLFDLDAPDMDVFGKLPQWLQDKIKNNLNYEGSKLQAAIAGEPVVSSKPAKKKEEEKPQAEPDTFTEDEQDDKPW